MPTPAEIRQAAIRRLVEKQLRTLDWATVVDAFQATGDDTRAAFARGIAADHPNAFQVLAQRVLRQHLRGVAAAEVDAALEDGKLTLTEIDRLLF